MANCDSAFKVALEGNAPRRSGVERSEVSGAVAGQAGSAGVAGEAVVGAGLAGQVCGPGIVAGQAGGVAHVVGPQVVPGAAGLADSQTSASGTADRAADANSYSVVKVPSEGHASA